jgi:hypothetical protein
MISTEEEFKVFGNFAKEFGISRIHGSVNVKKYLEANDYSIEDAESYLEWRDKKVEKKLKDRRDDFQRVVEPLYQEALKACPKCPECNGVVAPAAIKTEKGDANVHGYNTVWQCSNPKCIYEKYSKKLKGDIMASLIGKEKTKELGKHNRMIKMSGE